MNLRWVERGTELRDIDGHPYQIPVRVLQERVPACGVTIDGVFIGSYVWQDVPLEAE
jgi:hypothetical protein